MSVTIHDGQVQINGIDVIAKQVDAQIAHAIASIDADPNIPAPVRAKLKARLEKMRAKAAKRIAKLDVKDVDQLGEELESIGEDIGSEMEDFGKEMDEFGKGMDDFGKGMDEWGKGMEKWGEKFGKDFQKQMEDKVRQKMQQGGNWQVHIDGNDDDNDMPDMDDSDMQDAVHDLGQLNLNTQQRTQLKTLRAESDAKVAAATANLERASESLKKQLENPSASEADISRSIDAVTQQEAAIRKARILAWVNARRLLDDSQRKQVEGAVKGRSH